MVVSEEAQKRKRVTLENLHERVAEGKIRDLKIILKADVQGSVQALRDSLERMSTNEIRLNVIHSGVGGINETDVTLAAASDAVIIGFSVRAGRQIGRGGAQSGRRNQNVSDHLRGDRGCPRGDGRASRAGEDGNPPRPRGNPRGLQAVQGRDHRRQFRPGRQNRRAAPRRALIRDGVVVHEGTLDSLRRFKDDVKEVEKGFECGIGLGNFQDIKAKDIVEVYTEESKARKLEPQA